MLPSSEGPSKSPMTCSKSEAPAKLANVLSKSRREKMQHCLPTVLTRARPVKLGTSAVSCVGYYSWSPLDSTRVLTAKASHGWTPSDASPHLPHVDL